MTWYRTSKTHSLPMPKRKLGKTGYEVGIFSLGGQGSLETQPDREGCVNIIQKAYDLGVNYFDTSPVYGPNHRSEKYYGEALEEFRKKIFLATKTHQRNRDDALKDIEGSLERLRTNYIDLWQIHNLTTMQEVNQVTREGGALEALIEMKDQGVVKNLGFTGHERPQVLREMMGRYDFDTVLCPINACDRNMRYSFIDDVVPEANEKKMGIIGMKVFSQGYIFHPKGVRTTWEALGYSLSQDISTVIVGVDDIPQLEENISVAKAFDKFTEEELKEIEEKTAKYKKRASFFRSEYGGYGSQNSLSEPYTIKNIKGK